MTPNEKETAIAETLAAFNQLADAARSMDHTRYFALFDHQQFTALNADGSVLLTFAQFKKMFLEQVSSLEKYNSLEFENVEVSVLAPTVCVLVNEYEANVELKSGKVIDAAGAGTQVWSKASGSWLLTHVSSSSKTG